MLVVYFFFRYLKRIKKFLFIEEVLSWVLNYSIDEEVLFRVRIEVFGMWDKDFGVSVWIEEGRFRFVW